MGRVRVMTDRAGEGAGGLCFVGDCGLQQIVQVTAVRRVLQGGVAGGCCSVPADASGLLCSLGEGCGLVPWCKARPHRHLAGMTAALPVPPRPPLPRRTLTSLATCSASTTGACGLAIIPRIALLCLLIYLFTCFSTPTALLLTHEHAPCAPGAASRWSPHRPAPSPPSPQPHHFDVRSRTLLLSSRQARAPPLLSAPKLGGKSIARQRCCMCTVGSRVWHGGVLFPCSI